MIDVIDYQYQDRGKYEIAQLRKMLGVSGYTVASDIEYYPGGAKILKGSTGIRI